MLTLEQCIYIKELRCGKITHSWRRISELYCEKYRVEWDLHGNQMHGIDLCEEAAKLLDENPHEEPWN